MNIIDSTYELLKEIKEKKYTFSYAINKKVNSLNHSDSDKIIIKDTLKGVVNRYYFLKHEVSGLIEEKNTKDEDILIISLALARYARNIIVDDVINFLSASNEENNYAFDIEKVRELFEKIAKAQTTIPEKYENNFVKKVSLLYSYPEWIVGMMKKHFGTKNAFKTIAASRKSAPINICVNPMKIEGQLEDSVFVKTDIASTSYEYNSKEPLLNNPLFKSKKIFVVDHMEQFLADELEPFQGDEILIIGGSRSHLSNLVAMKADDFAHVNYAAPSEEIYFSTKKMYEQFNLKSVNVFIAECDGVVTHVPYDKFDKVLVTPPNSEFGLIRQKPEILLTFNQNDLDGLIAGQKKYIEEACKFVKAGGFMLYSVPTINIKESFAIVNEFLSKHEEFEMEGEEIIFPYVNRTNGIYYAKLRKREIEE